MAWEATHDLHGDNLLSWTMTYQCKTCLAFHAFQTPNETSNLFTLRIAMISNLVTFTQGFIAPVGQSDSNC